MKGKTTLSRAQVDLPVVIDPAEPLTHQITTQLRTAMRMGTLTAGERLPSTRALAATLGVSRTVITEAYQQLYAEGWLDGRHGSGTYVADVTPQPLRDHVDVPSAPPVVRREIDLRPGRPWTVDFDEAAWRRAWRLASGSHPPSDEPDPYGVPGLRQALAEHLRRSRGMAIGPENVLVTQGTGRGLDILAATLIRPGDRVGIEEPGYRTARRVLESRGATLVPCRVDEHGLIPNDLPDGLKLIYTTPAHQFPLGGRLPVPRRQKLLRWARRTGVLIVEDDYDAEFRYDVAPLPALHTLDPERVVLLGTLSKSLAPDMCIGWLVAPPDLLGEVARRRQALADRTPGTPQEALRILIQRGDLDRHLRRMRLEYARRRAVVVSILAEWMPRGDTAGLHVVVELPGSAVQHVIEEAARQGVLLDSIEPHFQATPSFHGLVIGYGSASLTQVKRGCERLREILAVYPAVAADRTAGTRAAAAEPRRAASVRP